MAQTRNDRLLADIAREQFGLFTLTQALRAGLSEDAVKRGVAKGLYERPLPHVLRIEGSPPSWDQDLAAAILSVGEGSAASFGAAARKHGLDGFSAAPVEVSTVNRRRDLHLPFIVHRVDGRLLSDAVCLGGTSVTSIRRTILDLAGSRHPRTERALDQALREEMTTLGQMVLLFEDAWTRRRRGIAILRSLLEPRVQGLAPSDGKLGLLLWRLIANSDLPPPLREHSIQLSDRTIRVDLCYPDSYLILEGDSYAWHSDRASFEADRRRDAELQLLGWRVLRFTWGQIRWEADYVLSTIRSHLLLPRLSGHTGAHSAPW